MVPRKTVTLKFVFKFSVKGNIKILAYLEWNWVMACYFLFLVLKIKENAVYKTLHEYAGI